MTALWPSRRWPLTTHWRSTQKSGLLRNCRWQFLSKLVNVHKMQFKKKKKPYFTFPFSTSYQLSVSISWMSRVCQCCLIVKLMCHSVCCICGVYITLTKINQTLLWNLCPNLTRPQRKLICRHRTSNIFKRETQCFWFWGVGPGQRVHYPRCGLIGGRKGAPAH